MYKRQKKDTKWTIQKIGNVDIFNIKKEISNFDLEWNLDTSRQNIGMTHRKTQMFRLFATEYTWVPGTNLITEHFNDLKNKESKKELENIYKFLELYYSGKVIRCEIIKLFANSEILKHTDGGALLHYSRRVHIPIFTEKNITFTVLDNTVHMEEGCVYEINNQLPHSVKNPTEKDRVHIIIDIMPYDMINYKIRKENND